MANKRKKSYKKDTIASDKAEAKLNDHNKKYDNDELIEEILMQTLDKPYSGRRRSDSEVDISDILGVKAPAKEKVPSLPDTPPEPVLPEKESGADETEEKASEKPEKESSKDEPAKETPVGKISPAENAPAKAAAAEKTPAEKTHTESHKHDGGAKKSRPHKKRGEFVPEQITELHFHDETENAAKALPPEKKKEKKKKAKKSDEPAPLKPIFSIANIVYTAAAFAVITAAFLALPREGVSETEQRNLAAFPTFSVSALMSGEYTEGITDYFNDNVPYRDELKKAAAGLRSLYGVSYNDAEIVGPVAVITEDEEDIPVPAQTTAAQTATAPSTSKPAEKTGTKSSVTAAESSAPVTEVSETTAVTTADETTSPANTTKNVNEIAEGVVTNGQVVTKLSDGHWWGISLFGGGNGTVYANALNRFKQELGDSVNVYSMPVPTSGEYYLPDSYAQYNASHRKSIDKINSQLVGVIPVPAIDALWEHTSEDIYLRTDHHWQPLGAYYAAKCFAETAGVPFADISTMERVDIPGYMGTMYSFTESANLLSDPETFTYYKPTNSYTTDYFDTSFNYTMTFPFFIQMPVNGSYSTFMGADNKIVRITTDAGTGRKLVIFKDSYGNAEAPFFFGSFDEVYVCDMRYFDLNGVEFVKKVGATDLLFTACTFSAVGTNANGLEKILNNPVTEMVQVENG